MEFDEQGVHSRGNMIGQSTYVEELEDGQIISTDGNDDSDLWQVDLAAGIASLICNHTNPKDEFFHLEDRIGGEVFVLSDDEVAEHFGHSQFTGERPDVVDDDEV